jgi:hypothetical protein
MIKNNYIVLLSLLIVNSAFAQRNSVQYHQICRTIKNNKDKGDLEVSANRFVKSNQLYLSFYIGKSGSISVLLNDSVVKKYDVNVDANRTGDNPDYVIKVNIRSKKDILTVYFENEKSFFTIPIDRRYRVYEVVYQTGVWQGCVYIEKKKFFKPY